MAFIMIKQLQQALSDILLGKEEVIRLGITCLLANGHLLLEDNPGMGKTTFSHALAQLTGMQYRRIQFTSDLLPSDLLGVSIYDHQRNVFQFHKGPIFSQLILADEINRATPKTQSALLEAMEERQVTTDIGTEALPQPFFVIATQNPSCHTGTYPLPESQLDRFLMRLVIGYPPPDAERMLLKSSNLNAQLKELIPIINPQQLQILQRESQKVLVSELVLDYVQSLLDASRNQGWFNHGLSPRAGMGLVHAAQAFARTDDRDFVRPDDIQAVMPAVVNHRLIIKKSQTQLSAAELLMSEIEVPV
ncbi:TPA: MoxR family ATPase [Legionella pneumophila]|uniref:Methanol dehydrogenase regulatory protein n=4 Tax=Gammaproteobacteria TaxID=1236 RepID=Q5ZUA9_LEGPH|nr:methanol dehydrogenase regulatory protein [Legionella pneumophila subsp. pneumophila str. Philadelphia 1]AEW52090.1 methanol dehydrogenase regulatory protein [Legionella pneumophila subsp. pneumophila ATCC 43290]AGN14776.1 MoxR-like ATPase [Legionella pneumophila subsp. pneumophila str. Thunder Bay]OOK40693.1 MoxR-like ATPase [Legionella pneumophila subsp. pneumophila str. Sudbury]PNL77752.1 MoxR family ATPase [Legionella pneumophila subsp. pneumophila]PPK33109.1 MoxR family ATPase [Legione